MKKRFKIVLSFCMLFIACSFMVGMVYAATSVTVNVNSTINYTAPTYCEVMIYGRVGNAYNSSGTALTGAGYTKNQLLFDSTRDGTDYGDDYAQQTGSWSPSTVYFDPNGVTRTLVYYITVYNYSSDAVTYTLARTSGTLTNCTYSISPASASGTINAYSGTGAAPYRTLTITYTVTDVTTAISTTNCSYLLSLERQA